MSRKWILAFLVACPAIALAQPSPPRPSGPGGDPPAYQPAVPPPSNVNAYAGWPGYSGASTAAGSAMSGMSQVISAAGDYNLATSAAAVNMTQAQRNAIQNDALATNTYFELRATNRAARAAEAGPKPTMEQLVRIAHQGVPKPLQLSQLDPVNGKIDWPPALQDEGFQSQRAAVDELFAKRASYGGLGFSDQTRLRESIDAMADSLKEQIREIPSRDYLASKNFLKSLLYAATKGTL